MVHVTAPCIQQWQWSICRTVTPKLVSQLRKIRCRVSVPRRLQLASHRCRKKALSSLVFLESHKDIITIGPKLATDTVTQYGSTTGRLRTTFPKSPISHTEPGRQGNCNRRRREVSCHVLATDTEHRFLQLRDISLCSREVHVLKYR